jgi:hypothetical protein
MSKMGLHNPFGHLKNKLWSKEGPGIKLAIWILTTKNRESPRFPCMQVACHIALESSWRGLQLCFWRRFVHKVMGPPKSQESQPWEFQDSHLGVAGQNDIWVLVPWLGTKYTIRGKVVASPKFGLWWVLWIRVCLWFVLAPKVLQLCTNQLVV